MDDVYTLYEAKARFSELVRRVRAGERLTITYHGEPVAELGPVAKTPAEPTVEQRLAELERRGAASPAPLAPEQIDWRPLARRPGALARFLEERD